MIKKTVLPTKFQSFVNKRCLGVLANLISIIALTIITFIIFSIILACTSFEEENIRLIALVTALITPVFGCLAGVAWHKRRLYKRGYALSKHEVKSDILKNVLISVFIYFSVIMFL